LVTWDRGRWLEWPDSHRSPIGDNVEVISGKMSRIETYPNEPYQKGYVDFSEWSNCSASALKDEIIRGPPRTSMLNDVAYYWEEVGSSDLIAATLKDGTLGAVHLQKLVASNWLVLLEYIWATLSELERTLNPFEDPRNENTEDLLARLNQTLAEVNRLRRRLSYYLEELESTMRGLSLTTGEQDPGDHGQTDTSISDDFRFVHARLCSFKQKVESLATVVTGLLSVCQGRISASLASTSAKTAIVSANEARLVSRLTVLAVIFIPLSFSASILSMGGDFSPGESRFWVYFAVSIPMLLLILGFVFLWRKATMF
jgi:Mg2+ and Co2+ transporter CorA